MKYDCDRDAIVVLVEPAGPACHLGTTSCFTETFYGAAPESASGDELEEFRILKTLGKSSPNANGKCRKDLIPPICLKKALTRS